MQHPGRQGITDQKGSQGAQLSRNLESPAQPEAVAWDRSRDSSPVLASPRQPSVHHDGHGIDTGTGSDDEEKDETQQPRNLESPTQQVAPVRDSRVDRESLARKGAKEHS